jgi:hypothetical protein
MRALGRVKVVGQDLSWSRDGRPWSCERREDLLCQNRS